MEARLPHVMENLMDQLELRLRGVFCWPAAQTESSAGGFDSPKQGPAEPARTSQGLDGPCLESVSIQRQHLAKIR